MRKQSKRWLLLLGMFNFVLTVHSQNLQNTDKALDLIKQNAQALQLSKDALNEMYVTNAYYDEHTGLYMVYVQQTYKGTGIFTAIQSMAFKNNKLVASSGQRVAKPNMKANQAEGKAVVSASDAVRSAASHLNLQVPAALSPVGILKGGRALNFGSLDIAKNDVTTELLWFIEPDGSLRLGWQVEIAPVSTIDYWLVKVDAATGAYFGKINLTISCNFGNTHATCTDGEGQIAASSFGDEPAPPPASSGSYRVVPYPYESPSHHGDSLSIVANPWELSGAGSNATTLGWHSTSSEDYLISRGNNVWSMEDVNNNNGTGKSDTSITPYPNLTFTQPFQHIGILSLEFHVDKLSRPLL